MSDGAAVQGTSSGSWWGWLADVGSSAANAAVSNWAANEDAKRQTKIAQAQAAATSGGMPSWLSGMWPTTTAPSGAVGGSVPSVQNQMSDLRLPSWAMPAALAVAGLIAYRALK